MSLEEKMTRLKEIQNLLETNKVNLTESVKLLQEAKVLTKEIQEELNQYQNQLIQLNKEVSN